jgi:hypothetical protein
MVVVDLGPAFAGAGSIDDLAPLLPHARGSTASLVAVADAPARRLALPTFAFERAAWDGRHGRTSGWSFRVRKVGDVHGERAVLHVSDLGKQLVDRGVQTGVAKAS